MTAGRSPATRAAAAAVALLASGCGSFAVPDDWADRADLDRATDAAFPGIARVVPRLPPPTARVAVAGDDAIGYGLELRRGDAVERWILTVSVDEPRLADDNGEPAWIPRLVWTTDGNGVILFTQTARLVVRGHDADGRPGETTRPEVPITELEAGFAAACAALAGRDHAEVATVPEAVLASRRAGLAMLGLLRVVRDDPMLSRILWKVVRLPSFWGVITNFGVDVDVVPGFQDAAPATPEQLAGLPAAWLDEPVWRLPVRIDVNGEPVLLVQMLVQQPRAPLTLGAGCLALVASHPADPELRFSMQVLDGELPPATAERAP